MDGLFREEAVKARQPQWLGTTRLALPVSHGVWGLLSALAIIALLGWLFLGHYTRREHVSGRLVPDAGLIRVTARSAGTVTKINISEAAEVHEAQVLLAVAGDRSSRSVGKTNAAIAARLHDQQTQLRATLKGLEVKSAMQADSLHKHVASLQAQINQIDAQIRLQRKHVATATGLVEKIMPLRQSGVVSSVEFNQYQAKALSQKEQMKSLRRQRIDLEQQQDSLRAQLTQLPLETAAKSHELRGKLAQLGASLAQNALSRTSILRAPVAGVVSAVMVQPGQAVQPGQTLISLMPQGASLEAQLLVPSDAIGFVHKGTPVVLHYQAFPYQKFGAQDGRVVQVSRNALTSTEISELLGQQALPKPLYRVKVRLASQTIQAYGEPQALLPGMTVDADLLLDRRRMIEWIFEPLYGMARKDGKT